MHRFRPAALAQAIVLALMFTCAQAAELGDTVVRSYIGQPLIADIELTALADPNVAVQVRLAHPDVYKGANIAMHPALSSLNMSVMRRDGRQFLHITSVKQVDSEYLHLFVELIEGGKRSVRAETLWLGKDPSPPPPPPPLPPPLPKPQPLPLPLPPPQAQSLPPPPVPVPVTAAVARFVPAPVPAPAIRMTQPVPALSCPTSEQVKACAAVNYQNGLLSAQIVELEEKVKALELAIRGSAEFAEPAAKPVALTPKAPPPPPKTVARPKEGFPWLMTIGLFALLAAIGGGAYYLVKKRKARPADPDAVSATAWYSRMAGKLKRKPKGAPPAEPEPSSPA